MEELLHHYIEVGEVGAFEEFCHKGPTVSQHSLSNHQRCLQELCLQILVNLVKARHVWCPVAHNQIHFLTLKNIENLLSSLLGCNVAHDEADTGNRGYLLEVDGCDSDVVGVIPLIIGLVKFLSEYLTPRARCRAEVDSFGDPFENVELLVNL